MTGRMRVPRTRGVLCGLLLVLLGAWAALIAFIGPYFHFAYTPDTAWTYTSDRLWMEILPGAGAFLGGLIVMSSAHRAVAMVGGWLAALSGAWLALTLPLSAISGMPHAGNPTGSTHRQVAETLGFFTGVGVLIVFLAALALGRFAVLGVREVRAAEEEAAADERWQMLDGYGTDSTGMPGDPSAPEAEQLGGLRGGAPVSDATSPIGAGRSGDATRGDMWRQAKRDPGPAMSPDEAREQDAQSSYYGSDRGFGTSEPSYRTVNVGSAGTQDPAGLPQQRNRPGPSPDPTVPPQSDDEVMERIRQQASRASEARNS